MSIGEDLYRGAKVGFLPYNLGGPAIVEWFSKNDFIAKEIEGNLEEALMSEDFFDRLEEGPLKFERPNQYALFELNGAFKMLYVDKDHQFYLETRRGSKPLLIGNHYNSQAIEKRLEQWTL